MGRIDFDLKLTRSPAGHVRADVFTNFINELARQTEKALDGMKAEYAAELAKRDERIARLEGHLAALERGVALKSVRR